MEIKRYSVMDILKTTTNGTEIYHSRADLIAAGCLVPVPDGNRCLLRHATTDYVLADDEHIYRREGGDWWSLRDKFQFLVGLDMFVQPVRLVRLEDVDVQESEYDQYSHWELSGERPEDHT